jgi:Protein of unknown function (DUF2971)
VATRRAFSSTYADVASMPYQYHFAFVEPQDQTARLWRYMSLPQFLSVLDTSALFFPSVATLSEGDPYEGEPVIAKFRHAEAQGESELRKLRLRSAVFKHLNFFNCWHMNDNESDAMWKIYSHRTEGVAIQSTVKRLMESFRNSPDTVYMGEIKYVDHNRFDASELESFAMSDYMFKRLAFQHEKEVRVGTYRQDVRIEFFDESGFVKDQEGVTAEDILLSPYRKGVSVNIEVPTLIERVVVSPLAASWFSDLVVSLCKKLSNAFDVVPSEMSRPSRLSE